ncbi:MAG: hypothetical protein WD749_14115 [Phycisphaerales bacterium]
MAGVAGALAMGAGAAAQPWLAPVERNSGAAAPQPRVAAAPPVTESRPLGGSTAAPAGSAAPAGPAASGRGWMVQTGLSLAGVLALAIGGGWVVRVVAKRSGGLRSSLGAGGRAPAGILEILGRYPVSRGATLILLKLDRRILLLSQNSGGRLGAGSFSTLAEITDPDEVASILVKARDIEGDSMAERFRSMLSRYDQGMGDAAGDPGGPGGRSLRSSAAGDTAEVWDTAAGAIPVVDLTRQPGPGEHTSAAGVLRRRLAALRGQGGEGGA